jgi:hypothetical protein
MRADELLRQLVEALAAEGCQVDDYEADAIERMHRLRRVRDRAIRDAQASELLPLGRGVAAERLGVAASTVYKMAHRYRRFSTLKRTA